MFKKAPKKTEPTETVESVIETDVTPGADGEAEMAARMEAVMKKECIPYSLEVCRVVPAALGESIGDLAALAVAAEAEKR